MFVWRNELRRMRFAASVALAALSVAAFADVAIDLNGVTWTYTVSGGEAKIYAGDKTAAIPTETAGNLMVPATLGGYPVTRIGAYAFYGCNRLLKVDMSGCGSLTKIDDNAFNGCSLVQVEIPISVDTIGEYAFFQSGLERVSTLSSLTSIGTGAFAQCNSLRSVDLSGSGSLKSLPPQLFAGCGALASVVMPDITTIGALAFKDCTALKEITLPDSLTSIDSSAFTGSALETVYVSEGMTASVKAAGLDPVAGGFKIIEPGAVTTYTEGGYTWYYRPIGEADGVKTAEIYNGGATAIDPLPIEPVTVPSTLGGLTVTRIGGWAFAGCDKMTGVTIPATVTHIGAGAFNECDALTSVVIPDGVTEIDGSAFYSCNALASVVIGAGVTRIGSAAFYDCTALKSVVIPDGVTDVGNSAFSSCSALESVAIGAGVTRIGDAVFYECDALKSVVIPVGVTSIGEYAFYGCDVLESVAIGDGVTRIGERAFMSCPSLKSVNLPSRVTVICEEAFSSCSALESVAIPAGVTYIGPSAFDGTPSDLKVYVAAGKSDAVNDLLVASGLDTSGVSYQERFTVTFDPNGGNTAPVSRLAVDGLVGPLPVTARDGYTFDGWFTAASGGEQVATDTAVTADVTFYAQWTKVPDPVTPDPVTPAPVTLVPVTPVDPESLDPFYPGEMTGYKVLNPADIWDPVIAPKATVLSGAVYYGNDVVGIVELKVGKLNKNRQAKVSGAVTMLDGTKHTVKSKKFDFGDKLASTLILDVKGGGSMRIAIGGIGGVNVFSGEFGKFHVQTAKVGTGWGKSTATVNVDVKNLDSLPSGILEALLPTNEVATAAGGKWSFKKAASVKWTKVKEGMAPLVQDAATGKGLVVDTSGGKTNLSGLKLTYTPKKGTFKGTFKLYELKGEGKSTKLKKYTVNIGGVVVDGVGYGKATSKKPSFTWSVTVK